MYKKESHTTFRSGKFRNFAEKVRSTAVFEYTSERVKSELSQMCI